MDAPGGDTEVIHSDDDAHNDDVVTDDNNVCIPVTPFSSRCTVKLTCN